MFNEVREYSLFSQTSAYVVPPEIPSEVHQLPYGFTSGILYFQFEKKNMNTEISAKDRIMSIVPVIVMLSIILIETRAYMFWYILPMMDQTGFFTSNYSFSSLLTSKHSLQLLIFLALCINLYLSTILTILTPPGEVIQDLQLEADNLRENIYQVMISEEFLEKMKKHGNCERKRTLFPRFCRSCLMVKPDRSHHCSVCNKCVLRMDHHCPYVNNCIGQKNYKYFMNMVMSGTAASVFISFTMWEGVKMAWENSEYEVNYQVDIGIAYFGNVVLSVVLCAFCFFHFYLISNALTTIEFREKMTVKFDKSPYHVSCLANFVQVFGSNPFVWCLPLSKVYIGPNTSDPLLSFKSSELS